MGFRYTTSSIIFLVILSSTQIRFMAEGRALLKKDDTSQIVNEDNKARVRAQIGSRPPKCEGMCSSCGPCEAIQVPNNFQAKPGKRNSSTVVSTIAYARGNEYSSNYKPMSWKCKCGTIIFNP
uniref:EPIDERMAL PATTERNING FACTOR-like protein 2 n=1 Tax=Fragaria vesca subsp. vesca TaxID=101020 RepID=UPI0005CA4ACD|nr:PREDICTED: EPIDERMAL PATTERNING FACTOR-like protein 2 [Fragaria vesca subsp. vesca]